MRATRTVQSTRFILLSFVMMLAFAAGKAMAADYYVDITNRTGYTIMYMYVSPSDAQNWEEDVLGNDVLLDGSSQRVWLRGYYSPMFDIQLVDEDGDTYTFMAVDVSRNDLIVTLDHLD